MALTEELYGEYQNRLQKIADIKYASAVLQWDQETYLPPKGNEFRGRQIATLSEIAHQEFVSDEIGNLLAELSGRNDLHDIQQKNVLLSLEDYKRNKKLPSSFVRKLTESVNKSFHAWIAARKANDFSVFTEPLDQIIQLKKQETDLLGYSGHPYNALMNDYDKGLTVAKVDHLFSNLAIALRELLDKIRNQPQVNDEFLHRYYNKQQQWEYGIELLKTLHFDFEAGRQDISEHPFTTNFNSRDVRLTTRIDEQDISNMTWSCIHECGHGLYEQGLPESQYGLPLGEYCSLSIHESQSRIWENCIGRSLEFWEYQFPVLQSYFPEQLKDISLTDFYKAINKVQPSLIRTESDEISYHFHVMVRYELEKKLIEGSLKTKEIPAYWNEQYLKYLGVTVPDDKSGCLQDVHWSHGSFGYFATYSIGSLYAAQFFQAANNDTLPGKIITRGDTTPLFNWLQQHIYPFGRYFKSDELCERATGEPLNSMHFINYAFEKFSKIYLP